MISYDCVRYVCESYIPNKSVEIQGIRIFVALHEIVQTIYFLINV